MELEALLALLVRLVGRYAAQQLLLRVVQGVRPEIAGSELERLHCALGPGEAFDCDELGIYTDEDD